MDAFLNGVVANLKAFDDMKSTSSQQLQALTMRYYKTMSELDADRINIWIHIGGYYAEQMENSELSLSAYKKMLARNSIMSGVESILATHIAKKVKSTWLILKGTYKPQVHGMTLLLH